MRQVLVDYSQDGSLACQVEGYDSPFMDPHEALKAILAGSPTHRTCRGLTLDKYLSLGVPDIEDILGAVWTNPTVLGRGSKKLDARPTVSSLPRRSSPQEALLVKGTAGHLGIDLDHRGIEVAKLLRAGFGGRIRSAGYDFDDVLQEVYRGLIARNAGKCPWDSSKSSFGHYVHMVCGCILSNYHRRMQRIRRHEQVGMRIASGKDGMREVDAGSDGAATVAGGGMEDADGSRALLAMSTLVAEALEGNDAALALRVLPLVAAGLGRGEIAAELGVSKQVASRGLALLREVAASMRD